MTDLRISLLTYRDDQIDSERASRLVVYRYPLSNAVMKFQEWKEVLDENLSEASYPYYMSGGNLYVALTEEGDPLPVIKTRDNTTLEPERVEYSPRLNPVWLKLLLRQIGHKAGHTRGFRALGKPLLKINEWGGQNPGIEAIDIEGYVNQRSDGNTTEVKIKFSNVALRQLAPDSPRTGKLWKRNKSGWLDRRFSGNDEQGVLFREISNAKGTRKQRPFIDLKTPEGLRSSRGYLIQRVIQSFVEAAQQYGFHLLPETLHLQKYPSQHKSDKHHRLRSLPVEQFEVTLVDARENVDTPIEELRDWLNELLLQEGLKVDLTLMQDQPENIEHLNLLPDQRYLVVLDQSEGTPQDPYVYTNRFSQRCAVQHIILNPYELDDETSVEQWFTMDDEGNITGVYADYFDYRFEQLKAQASFVALKLVVSIKELHFKQLLNDASAKVSEYLPQQAHLLDGLTLISDGYLFTVEHDRPVVLPFALSEPQTLEQLNALLMKHAVNCQQLMRLVVEQWPYRFGPEQDIQKDVNKFIRAQVIVLRDQDTILIQNPGNNTPLIMPDGIEQQMPVLEGRKNKFATRSWLLPAGYENSLTQDFVQSLFADSSTETQLSKLVTNLPTLCQDWQQTVHAHLVHERMAFDPLRKALNEKSTAYLGGDKKVLGMWWLVLSKLIDRPVYDPRSWLRKVPGLQGLWFDPEQGYYLVGELNNLNLALHRQPSTYRWHALRGKVNPEMLMPLLDVDFIRIGRFAGRVFPNVFIRCYQDIFSRNKKTTAKQAPVPPAAR
nr:hypothetical protein [uncultured Halomonas sp.]